MEDVMSMLDKNVKDALDRMGYVKLTPVQREVIPLVLEGSDVVAVADTGTGKTAAFGIPMVQMLSKRGIGALVLVPTRELAAQVADEIYRIGRFKRIKSVAMYGGRPVFRDLRLLEKNSVNIVVGTPGRIADLVERGALRLEGLRFLVLDEVDRMLDMGFEEDLNYIVESTPLDRQTLFFSATLPPEIRNVMERFLKEDYKLVQVTSRSFKPKIEHRLVGTSGDRFATLLEVLRRFKNGGRAVVFVNRKIEAQKLFEQMTQLGFGGVKCLHGDMSQRRREMVMRDFRTGRVKVLVATDVAARGIDVKGIELVVNYRLPDDPDMYVHRAGRTARAGSSGLAVSLVSRSDIPALKRIDLLRPVRIERL